MPPDGTTIDPQDEITQLRADLAQARRHASEEQARADTLDLQVSQARSGTISAQMAQVAAQETAASDSITSIDNEIKGLKAQWANLQAEGKFNEAADVQEALGDATARRRQAMQAKEYYAGQKTQLANAPTDQVEQFLSQNPGVYSQEDATWIRQHRRYATDGNFRQRVMAAHSEAVDKLGLAQRSPEDYQHLERRAYMRPDPAPATPAATTQTESSAPTGYQGDEPTSAVTTDLDGGDELAPEIIIKEPDMPSNDGGPAFGRRAEQPQARAAGPGAMRAAVAGSPTRRGVSETGRRTVLTLTPGERETALALAPHIFSAETLKGGEAAILQEYNTWKNSPASERVRQGWIDRRG